MEVITFGPRKELIEYAKEKIRYNSDKYVNHIYGEKEVGGTTWMYLSPVPFEKLDFVTLPEEAPPRLTESIQHGVFKYFIPPIGLYALLGAAMKLFKDEGEQEVKQEEKTEQEGGEKNE